MNSSLLTAYTVLAVILALVDFNYCYTAYQRAESIAEYLGLSSFCAGVITVSYLFSVRTASYLSMSAASSIYFIGIDWMLVCLLHFVYQFTELHMDRSAKIIRRTIRFYALFDSIVMILNIFLEIAVSYKLYPASDFNLYAYEMKPLYVLHLVFTYILVALILFVLIRKALITPRQYRNQYFLIVLAILLVVLINAVFLFQENDLPLANLDWSVFGYSLGLYFMFWATFQYRKKDMLNSLAMTIFENIDQGIVLFDHMQKLIMYNQRARHLLPDIPFDQEISEAVFLEKCAISPGEHNADHYSIQCEKRGNMGQPLRCDFSCLKDKTGRITGNLFVFTDETDNSDLMTGFQRWETFKRYAAEYPYQFDHPTAVALFDIVGLGDINRTFSREVGDQRIRSLAKLMRIHMPKETVFVRGHEAHLVAICTGIHEKELRRYVDEILTATAGTVFFGISETTEAPGESRNVIKTVETASRTLQAKKLLSSKSFRSQTLTSLVRALQESDSDTESHVVRTQKMGIELGKRIGLNDEQMTQLQLLCLLHDIGKIGIPLEILNKPGQLTEREWIVLQTHSEKGYQIAMSSEELKPIAPMILYHHERWDGKGYPERLSGESIPILSRIISVVDSYDAMVNNRSYRKGRPPEEAQNEIRRCSGTQFDPELAEEFLQMLSENPQIALGEKTGGQEVRVFIQSSPDDEENGNTYLLPYSRYILDLDDTIIEIDDRFEEITGYSREEVIGKMAQYDLIPTEDRPYYILQVNNSFAHSDVAFLKHEIVRKDGSRTWVICHGKRYYDSAEKAFRSEINIFSTEG